MSAGIAGIFGGAFAARSELENAGKPAHQGHLSAGQGSPHAPLLPVRLAAAINSSVLAVCVAVGLARRAEWPLTIRIGRCWPSQPPPLRIDLNLLSLCCRQPDSPANAGSTFEITGLHRSADSLARTRYGFAASPRRPQRAPALRFRPQLTSRSGRKIAQCLHGCPLSIAPYKGAEEAKREGRRERAGEEGGSLAGHRRRRPLVASPRTVCGDSARSS